MSASSADGPATTPAPPGPDDVTAAAERIRGHVHRTPVVTSSRLDAAVGARVFLKAENLQRTGAFKLRGATNAVAVLAEQGVGHVATYSSGNHGQALARAAAGRGLTCTVLMPTDAPAAKVAATRGYGAEVVTYDRYRQDRRALAGELADERGAVIVPPFDHPLVVAGQGTAVLELWEDAGPFDVVVTPIGGGGLLAGSALAIVAAGGSWSSTRVIGVEPAGRRAARDALAAGEVVDVAVPRTICDGQQTERIGAVPLGVLRDAGADVVGATDDQVADTVRFLAATAKLVVEPSGASALAAVRHGLLTGLLTDAGGTDTAAGGHSLDGARIGVVLSGGNVDLERLSGLLA